MNAIKTAALLFVLFVGTASIVNSQWVNSLYYLFIEVCKLFIILVNVSLIDSLNYKERK